MEIEKELTEIKNRLEKLENAVLSKRVDKSTTISKDNESELNFSLNERAFIKKYSVDFSSGQQFFTIILTYLSKGNKNTSINVSEISKVWKRCSGIISIKNYHSNFATRAKENGWVDRVKNKNSYTLGQHWKNILKKHDSDT